MSRLPFFGKYTIETAGVKYMTRYRIGRLTLHIFHRGDADPDPHDHPWNFWTFPLQSYVEEVVDPRLVKGMDTPFDGKQNMICPTSEVLVKTHLVKAFRLHYRSADHTHRVLGKWTGLSVAKNGHVYPGAPMTNAHTPLPQEGRFVTIVWRSKSFRDWGFLKNNGNLWCWVPFLKYIYEGGKDAPCE